MNTAVRSVFDRDKVRPSIDSNVYDMNVKVQRTIISELGTDWHRDTKGRLDVLVSKLERNWDGYGGKPVNFLNAVFALKMLESICRPSTPSPSIVPGSNGDLQLEWHTIDTDIEIHILSPNRVHAWRLSPETGGEGQDFSLENDFTDITSWIGKLTESAVASQSAAA
jgi:hypothetical protein